MISVLNDLRVVPIERLVLHEAHDPGRLSRLSERMQAEGVQRNPVLVAPHDNDYLVLDGAHRFQTLKELGSKFVLVQLSELPKKIESWGHVLEVDPGSAIFDLVGIEASAEDDWLARLTPANGDEVFLRASGEGLAAEVEALWALQALYPEGVVKRVDVKVSVAVDAGEPVIRYRQFTPEELVYIVGLGEVLPAGITRFRVRERVLGVRFPLEKLRDGDPDERGEELKIFVRNLWNENRIRYYGEPVVLFE